MLVVIVNIDPCSPDCVDFIRVMVENTDKLVSGKVASVLYCLMVDSEAKVTQQCSVFGTCIAMA